MSTDELLPEEKVIQLRARQKQLKREIKSKTIWAISDPPEKTEEEIEKMREGWKVEYDANNKVLRENTRKKKALTRAKNKREALKKK